jgi:selenocysteine lyase/cysteine desulfurase
MSYYPYQSRYKKMIVGTDVLIPLTNGRYAKEINFDNAATTPPLISVMKAINDFAPWYSSIHRGSGYKSQLSSEIYENARKIIGKFVNIDNDFSTVIFVKNTTEALNKISDKLAQSKKDGIILSSYMEHHSNDLPWRKNFRIDYINITKKGNLCINSYANKLRRYNGKVKLVTLSGASNVTGYKTNIHQFAELAHKYGAKILIDGAQLIPHSPINMKSHYDSKHIDYLVFSSHKIYAPFGTGVLIAPKDTFSRGTPTQVGGGTVKMVTPSYVIWDNLPHKEEAGTPNLMGIVALQTAISTLSKIGMDEIENFELKLTQYTLDKLNKFKDVIIYGNERDCNNRIGIITFNIKGLHHSTVAEILSKEAGISVRSGCFCAQPYIQKLLNLSPREIYAHKNNPYSPHPGMVRISFGLYNDYGEIDVLIKLIKKIIKNKTYYRKKYPCKDYEIFNSARY